MSESSRVKIGAILLFISLIFIFAVVLKNGEKGELIKNTKLQPKVVKPEMVKPNDETSQEPTHKIAFIEPEPSPIVKQHGKIRGETSVVKFEKDLEKSIEIQEVPKLWIEFTDKNGQIQEIEIPKQAKTLLEKRWKRMLEYYYKNSLARDRETKVNLLKDQINDAAIYATTIDDIEIITPLEKRKLSQEEAFEMIRLVSYFAVDRYTELQNMNLQIKPQKNSQ